MRRVAKLGVFALVLILSAMPTMACLLPSVTLTAAEHECCKRMASRCGQAGMPNSHSCCQRITAPEASIFLKAPNAQLDHVANNSYLPVTAPASLNGNPQIHATFDLSDHGPPGSPPASISVLRI